MIIVGSLKNYKAENPFEWGIYSVYDSIESSADENLAEIDEPGEPAFRSIANPLAVELCDTALVLIKSGDITEALNLLQRSIILDSGYARAHFNLGIVYQRNNKLGDAIHEYKTAVDLRKHYYGPAYNLGLLYSQVDKPEDALEWLNRAAESNRSQQSAPTHYHLGLVHYRLGDLKKSEASYRQALKLRPNYAAAHYNLAVLLKNQDFHYEAIIEFEKAAAVGLRDARVFKHLANCYGKVGKDSAAAEAYSKAIQLEPNDRSAFFNYALVLAKMKKLDQSVTAYQNALQIDSNFTSAHFNLAVLYSRLKKPDSCIFHYRQAIRSDAGYSKAYYNLALYWSGRGLIDSALTMYKQVLSLDPENLKARLNLALNYSKMNRLTEAVHHYHVLIDMDPGNEKGLNNLGSAYRKLNKFDSALVCFNRLVALAPGPEAYFNRAKTYVELDSLDAAKNDYRQAIEIRNNYAKAYHNLSLLEKKTGNPLPAVELMLKAIEFDSKSWKSHWVLGQLYIDLGLTDKAKDSYVNAAILKPDSPAYWKEYNELVGPKPNGN